MHFLNSIDACLLHTYNEVINIKSVSRVITSDKENNKELYKVFHTGSAEELV